MEDELPPTYDPTPAHALLDRHAKGGYPRMRQFGRAQLLIEQGVFDPTLTHVSPFLLRAVKFTKGARTLDMFSGSGAFAINAALNGLPSLAIDNSPAAVRCARHNAALNQVTSMVDVRLGTLTSCLDITDRFDLVIANPPLLPGMPDSPLAAAIFDPGLQATIQFIEQLGRHLSPAGRCYLLTSDVIERLGHDVDRLCHGNGLVSSIIEKADFGYETYRVHLIRSSA